jgi:hypothetical protein
MYKVVVYAPGESADTLPLFLLYPYSICTLGDSEARVLNTAERG